MNRLLFILLPVLSVVSLSGCSRPSALDTGDDISPKKGWRSARIAAYSVMVVSPTGGSGGPKPEYSRHLVDEFLAAALDWRNAHGGVSVQATRFVVVSHGSSLIRLQTRSDLLADEIASILSREASLDGGNPLNSSDEYSYKAWLEAGNLIQEIRIRVPCVVFLENECLRPDVTGATSAVAGVEGKVWISEADGLFDPGSPGFSALPEGVRDCVLENEKSRHEKLTVTINETSTSDDVVIIVEE